MNLLVSTKGTLDNAPNPCSVHEREMFVVDMFRPLIPSSIHCMAIPQNIRCSPHVRSSKFLFDKICFCARAELAHLRIGEHTTPLLSHSPIFSSATPGQALPTLLQGKPKSIIEGSGVLC